ncbi:hypothetical protein [Hymenobacter swuensis]|uniref:Uncharacterized protein n=1 Tax=Hymenobacter swuensis DY53 TaxID=1227739 RepID=W8EU50_9BACT|nr:hypothetical protein [Hymenobacter swuensis]AHJ95307.1 hypothetical protein Hsw_PB0017 [Hymenobacter swuensis DY53]
MKLYSHPTGPRPQAFYLEVPTPASAYRLQQQLLQAYNEQLYGWWHPDDLYLACFGDYGTRQTRKGTPPPQAVVNKRTQALEDRVGYEVPELIGRMTLEELEQAASVLLTETLPGFITHVLGQERTLQYRLDDPSWNRLQDEGHARAAGLGKSKPMTGRLPVPTLPEVTPVSTQPVANRPMPLPPTPVLRPAPVSSDTPTLVRLRVNRAQERRRLKRKRR